MKTSSGERSPRAPDSPNPAAPPPGAPISAWGFQPLGPPRPGEWRRRFPERPQSLPEYVASGPNRRGSTRRLFYLQPLGSWASRDLELLERSRDYAEVFFGLPTRLREPLPSFEEAYIASRRQSNSSMIIDRLVPQVPEDALVYLAVAEGDLFGRGLRFVFGEGDLERRAGVYSLARVASPERGLFLRRALRLMTHEAGHLLSIPHCATYRCVMEGSNSLAESDAQPLHLCPVDLGKVAWNTGVEPRDRYLRLRKFYETWGLRPEADWVLGQIERPHPGVQEMAVLEPGTRA